MAGSITSVQTFSARGFVRFRLLTCFVLMLSTSAVLLLNFTPVTNGSVNYYQLFPQNDDSIPSLVKLGRQATFGWPFTMKEADWYEFLTTWAAADGSYRSGHIRAVIDQSNLNEIFKKDKKKTDETPEPTVEWLPNPTILNAGIWNWTHAAWNGGIALIFLVISTLLTEFALRRRDRRKQSAKAVTSEAR